MKIHAVIPAAGKGERFRCAKNKIFTVVNGKPLLWWTVRRLESSRHIDDITLVVNETSKDIILKEKLLKDFRKIRNIVLGGPHRHLSVKEGVESLKAADEDIVLIHDAVRPCIDDHCIEAVINEAVRHGAAILGVKIKPTIKLVHKDMFVAETLDRDHIYEIQTPQAFVLSVLKECYAGINKADDFIPTDEAAIIELSGRRVKVVEGSYSNIKVTTLEDVALIAPFLKPR